VALCLIGAGETVRLAVTAFSLSWMHTVEKVPWMESWRVEPTQLVLTEARVKGSGAGMEPPPNARHEDGWYVWEPSNPERSEIVLRMTGFARWTFCADGIACRPLNALFGRDADPVTVKPCA
jgi:hypothetical protein